LKVKVGIEEMGSECKKWMIFGFVIAISFSLAMEGALAARHLMQEIPSVVCLLISCPDPLLGSANSVP